MKTLSNELHERDNTTKRKRYDNFLKDFENKHVNLRDVEKQEEFYRELTKFNEDPSVWDDNQGLTSEQMHAAMDGDDMIDALNEMAERK